MRTPTRRGGPRSPRLRPWPPNRRRTGPRGCCTESCPSAGERASAREPPTGPSRATERGSALSRGGVPGGGVCGGVALMEMCREVNPPKNLQVWRCRSEGLNVQMRQILCNKSGNRSKNDQCCLHSDWLNPARVLRWLILSLVN